MSDQKKPRPIEALDLVGIAGLVCVIAGAWMAWRPAAPILAGAILFVWAWVMAGSRRPPGAGTV